MIFIATISTAQKNFDFRQTHICKNCGRYAALSVFMTYSYFSFFFIPLFRWNKQYFAVSNCCNAQFSIPAHLGKQIEKGISVTLTPDDLHPTHTFQ